MFSSSDVNFRVFPQATVYYIPTRDVPNTRLWSAQRIKVPTYDTSEIFTTQININSAFMSWRGNTEFASSFQRFLKNLETRERDRLRDIEIAKNGATPRYLTTLHQLGEEANQSLKDIEKAKRFVTEAAGAYDQVKAFSISLNKYLNGWLLKEQTPAAKEQIHQLRLLRKDLEQLALPPILSEAAVKEYVANTQLSLPDLKQRFEGIRR